MKHDEALLIYYPGVTVESVTPLLRSFDICCLNFETTNAHPLDWTSQRKHMSYPWVTSHHTMGAASLQASDLIWAENRGLRGQTGGQMATEGTKCGALDN